MRDVLLVLASSFLIGLLWGPLAWKRMHEHEQARKRTRVV